MTPLRQWERRSVRIRETDIQIVSRPGVPGFADAKDVSLHLLAEHAPVASGEIAVNLACGSGLLGAAASVAYGAAHVFMSDRSIAAVEAARRTLDANSVTNAMVFAGQGSIPFPADLRADVVAVRLALEKVSVLQLLWDAFHLLRIGGRCYLAGARNEGIKTATRHLETLFGSVAVRAYSSGHRVLEATKQSDQPLSLEGFEDPFIGHDSFHEARATLRGFPLTIASRPGVFAWNRIDEATALLADTMVIPAGASMLDLGCGSGALGMVASRLSASGRVTMVDVDTEAVRSAQRSVTLNGLENCRVLASDAGDAVRAERFDIVVTNPPFHVGKSTNLDVPRQFIADAWTLLAPGGMLYLVANRTLPYERAIMQQFGNYEMVRDERRFKVLGARRSS